MKTFEQFNLDIDPYGEEQWEEPKYDRVYWRVKRWCDDQYYVELFSRLGKILKEDPKDLMGFVPSSNAGVSGVKSHYFLLGYNCNRRIRHFGWNSPNSTFYDDEHYNYLGDLEEWLEKEKEETFEQFNWFKKRFKEKEPPPLNPKSEYPSIDPYGEEDWYDELHNVLPSPPPRPPVVADDTIFDNLFIRKYSDDVYDYLFVILYDGHKRRFFYLGNKFSKLPSRFFFSDTLTLELTEDRLIEELFHMINSKSKELKEITPEELSILKDSYNYLSHEANDYEKRNFENLHKNLLNLKKFTEEGI